MSSCVTYDSFSNWLAFEHFCYIAKYGNVLFLFLFRWWGKNAPYYSTANAESIVVYIHQNCLWIHSIGFFLCNLAHFIWFFLSLAPYYSHLLCLNYIFFPFMNIFGEQFNTRNGMHFKNDQSNMGTWDS